MAAKYRVAIIGTGRMGGLIEDEIPPGDPNKPYGHFPAYEYIEETEVVAVATAALSACSASANGSGSPTPISTTAR